MPVYVAVEEPRTGVVSEEPDRDVITSAADADDIPNNGVLEVVGGITSTADHGERMPVYVNRVLSKGVREHQNGGAVSLAARTEYSRVHRWHHQEWSARRSCLARVHRWCLREGAPRRSLHRSGSGATQARWGAQREHH
jgi:hypothetical protein